MQYFKNFSAIYYTLNNETRLLVDITKRVILDGEVINNTDAYVEYQVKDTDTLQSISNAIYEQTYPFWIIMLVNKMLNPYIALPFNEANLLKYISNKYGDDNIYNIHHYEDENGNIVDYPLVFENNNYYRIIDNNKIQINEKLIYNNQLYQKNIPVTNYEYENRINESKRNIKLLKPEFLDTIVEQFNSAVEGE